MKLNNLYDFDKTILNKDGSRAFFFYLLRQKPILFWKFFVMLFLCLFYVLKIIRIERLKEYLLSPLSHFKDREKVLKEFAEKEKKNCNVYYLKQMRDDDVVCSASAEFLVKALMFEINPKATVIGSNISLKTLKYVEGAKNCKGPNKIEIMKERFKTNSLFCKNAYSDSLSDRFMFDIAEQAFLIVKNKPVPYNKNEK